VRRSVGVIILASVSVLPACSHEQIIRHNEMPGVVSSDAGAEQSERRVTLAGEWEYEDNGIVQTLVLDERGNGHYGWQKGLFRTTALSGLSWTGYWQQRQNDREGRFEVRLSPDYTEGEGRWWYTRIETDERPQHKGGTFHLKHVHPSGKLSHASP
jgi:hypothetical protein